MKEFPSIITQRLLLDRPTIDDVEDLLFHMNSTPEISENTLTIPFPYREENAEIWIQMIEDGFQQKNCFIFAIREKEHAKLIGAVGIHLVPAHQKGEVGYWLGKTFWNRGYVTEALQEIIHFGFQELKLNKIFATHFHHNPASGKVLQKAGMSFEATLLQEYYKNNVFLDVDYYSILKENFQ